MADSIYGTPFGDSSVSESPFGSDPFAPMKGERAGFTPRAAPESEWTYESGLDSATNAYLNARERLKAAGVDPDTVDSRPKDPWWFGGLKTLEGLGIALDWVFLDAPIRMLIGGATSAAKGQNFIDGTHVHGTEIDKFADQVDYGESGWHAPTGKELLIRWGTDTTKDRKGKIDAVDIFGLALEIGLSLGAWISGGTKPATEAAIKGGKVALRKTSEEIMQATATTIGRTVAGMADELGEAGVSKADDLVRVLAEGIGNVGDDIGRAQVIQKFNAVNELEKMGVVVDEALRRELAIAKSGLLPGFMAEGDDITEIAKVLGYTEDALTDPAVQKQVRSQIKTAEGVLNDAFQANDAFRELELRTMTRLGDKGGVKFGLQGMPGLQNTNLSMSLISQRQIDTMLTKMKVPRDLARLWQNSMPGRAMMRTFVSDWKIKNIEDPILRNSLLDLKSVTRARMDRDMHAGVEALIGILKDVPGLEGRKNVLKVLEAPGEVVSYIKSFVDDDALTYIRHLGNSIVTGERGDLGNLLLSDALKEFGGDYKVLEEVGQHRSRTDFEALRTALNTYAESEPFKAQSEMIANLVELDEIAKREARKAAKRQIIEKRIPGTYPEGKVTKYLWGTRNPEYDEMLDLADTLDGHEMAVASGNVKYLRIVQGLSENRQRIHRFTIPQVRSGVPIDLSEVTEASMASAMRSFREKIEGMSVYRKAEEIRAMSDDIAYLQREFDKGLKAYTDAFAKTNDYMADAAGKIEIGTTVDAPGYQKLSAIAQMDEGAFKDMREEIDARILEMLTLVNTPVKAGEPPLSVVLKQARKADYYAKEIGDRLQRRREWLEEAAHLKEPGKAIPYSKPQDPLGFTVEGFQPGLKHYVADGENDPELYSWVLQREMMNDSADLAFPSGQAPKGELINPEVWTMDDTVPVESVWKSIDDNPAVQVDEIQAVIWSKGSAYKDPMYYTVPDGRDMHKAVDGYVLAGIDPTYGTPVVRARFTPFIDDPNRALKISVDARKPMVVKHSDLFIAKAAGQPLITKQAMDPFAAIFSVPGQTKKVRFIDLPDLGYDAVHVIGTEGAETEVLLLPQADLFHSMMSEQYAKRGKKFKMPVGADKTTTRSERPLTFIITNDAGEETGRRVIAGPEAAQVRGAARSGDSGAMRRRAIETIPELKDAKFTIDNADGYVGSVRIVDFDKDVLPSYGGAQGMFEQQRYAWQADARELVGDSEAGNRTAFEAMYGANNEIGAEFPMYHATTAAGKVRREGLKARAELGGIQALGYGPDDVVSVTFNEQRAINIVEMLKMGRGVANGEKRPSDVWDFIEQMHQSTHEMLDGRDPIVPVIGIQSIPVFGEEMDRLMRVALVDDMATGVLSVSPEDRLKDIESLDGSVLVNEYLEMLEADAGRFDMIDEIAELFDSVFRMADDKADPQDTLKLLNTLDNMYGAGLDDDFGGASHIGMYGSIDFLKTLEDDEIAYFQVFAKKGSKTEFVGSENELRIRPENLTVVDPKTGQLVGRPLKANPVRVKFEEPAPNDFKKAVRAVDPAFGLTPYNVPELRKMKRFYDKEAGIGFAIKYADDDAGKTAELVSMFRAPGSRYKGGGAHAVVKGIVQAKEDGAAKIILDCYDMTSTGATHGQVQLYEEFGFKITETFDWDPQYANKAMRAKWPEVGTGPRVVGMELDEAGWQEFLRRNPRAIDQGIIENKQYVKRWTDMDELDDIGRRDAERIMAEELQKRAEDTERYNRFLAGQFDAIDQRFASSLGLPMFDELADVEQAAIREVWAGTPKAAVIAGMDPEQTKIVSQYADSLDVLRKQNHIAQPTPLETTFEAPEFARQFEDHLARTEEFAEQVRLEGADMLAGNPRVRMAERVWYDFVAKAMPDTTPQEQRAVSRLVALLDYYKDELAQRDMVPEDLLEYFQETRAIQTVDIDGVNVPVGPSVGQKAVDLFNAKFSKPGEWTTFAGRYGLDTGEEGVAKFTQNLHDLSKKIDKIEWPEGLSKAARLKRVQELVGTTLKLDAREWDTIDANKWLQEVEQYFPHVRAGADKNNIFNRFLGIAVDDESTRNFIGKGVSENMPNVDNVRKLRGTIEAVNNLVGDQLFYEDPAKAMSVYIQRAVQATNAHDFLTEIRGMRTAKGERIVLPATFVTHPDGQTEWIAREGYKTFDLKEMRISRNNLDPSVLEPNALKGLGETGKVVFQAPVEIVDDIEQSMKAFFSDEQMQAFVKAYDKILGVWKGYATVLRPGFHMRNALTNIWQNMTAGVTNPMRYAQAAAIQADAIKIDEFIVDTMVREGRMLSPEEAWDSLVTAGKAKASSMKFSGVDYSMPRIYDMLKEHNIVGSGRIGSDIHIFVEQELQRLSPLRGALNPASQSFWAMRLGRRGGELVENNARVAHFVELLDLTGDPAAAAWSVRKYLFDYSELTPVERGVFKMGMPFYAWWKKNLALQLELLVSRPTPMIMAVKTQNRLNEGSHMENQPEWAQETGAFGIAGITTGALNAGLNKVTGGLLGLDETSETPMMMSLGLPYQDLMQLNTRDLYGSLSPAIKIPTETMTNYNVYFGKPVQLYDGELKTAPGALQAVNDIVQTKGSEKDKAGWNALMTAAGAGVVDEELKTAPWFNYFWSQFGPHVEAYGKALNSDDEKQAGYIISLLLGVKFTAVDPAKEAYYSMNDKARALQEKIKAVEDRGTDVPTMSELR